MTSPDDVPRDGSRDDPASGIPADSTPADPSPVEPGEPAEPEPLELPFDEDAAWRLIVENYGERAQLDPPGPASPPESAAAPFAPTQPRTGAPVDGPVDGSVFDRSFLDAVEAGEDDGRGEGPVTGPVTGAGEGPDPHHEPRHRRWSDEHEHFVPPEPPPVPRGTPARRIAWTGLFAPPLLMILAVVFRWALPTWLSMLLVAGFVGGFVFLVITMPRDGGDGWGDGAVV